MKYHRLKTLILILTLAYLCQACEEQTNGKRIESLVSDLPRNSIDLPMYWLEMETLVGWEKMILVFGYAENEPACIEILNLAKDSSPSRNFKCTVAN